MKKSGRWKNNIPISLFFVFTFVLYGPLSLFLPNSEDLWFPLSSVWKIVVPTSLTSLAILLLFFRILPEKVYGFLLKLFFGLSLALYIQGTYANINYGLLDGTEIQWSEYTAYAVIDTLLWIVCLILPFVIGRLMRKRQGLEWKALSLTAMLLTAMQIPAMAVQLINYQPNQSTKLAIMADNIFEVAPENNILIFVLDTVDELYYRDFLEKEPDYPKKLTGFVHYSNTLTSGIRTTIAVPAMFTGKPYLRQEASYSEYKDRVWSQKNALSMLAEQGYEVDVYSQTVLFSPSAAEYINNFTVTGKVVSSYEILMNKLYKLTCFKYAPHILKRYVWFETSEFDAAMETKKAGSNKYSLNDPKFYETYRNSGFTVDPEKDKVFKLYHLKGAHSPYRIDRSGVLTEESTLLDQLTAAFFVIGEMLDELREKGLYDQATIIIMADHGDLKMGAWPFFLLKEAWSTEEYRSSTAPVSLFDLPLLLEQISGGTLPKQEYGVDLHTLSEDTVRERHVFQNSAADSQVVIREYITTGTLEDKNPLTEIKVYYGRDESGKPYVLGQKLSFSTEATGNIYTIEGFGRNTGFRTAMLGPYSVLEIPISKLPAEGELAVHLQISDLGAKEGIEFSILANGRECFHGCYGSELVKEGIHFTVPTEDFAKDKKLKLEFLFPSIPQEELEEMVEKRTETFSLTYLVIEKQS